MAFVREVAKKLLSILMPLHGSPEVDSFADSQHLPFLCFIFFHINPFRFFIVVRYYGSIFILLRYCFFYNLCSILVLFMVLLSAYIGISLLYKVIQQNTLIIEIL